MDIIQRMKSTSFTNAEHNVLNYILKNPATLSTLTIQELAKVSYSSNPTIMRICRKLGFNGYREFRIAFLLADQQEKLIQKDIDFNRPFYFSETPKEILMDISSLYKESIELINTSIDIQCLDRMANQIFTHNRLFIYAIGDSGATSRSFANRLAKLNIYPILASENGETNEMAYNARSNDYVLFISYKGLHDSFLICAKRLSQSSVPMGIITANAKTPLLQYTSDQILIPHEEDIYNIATFYSQISFGYILDVIYSLIYQKDYAFNHRHKSLLDAENKHIQNQ